MAEPYECTLIDKYKQIVDQYTDAIIALNGGTVQSYMIDTGQTQQRVTREDVKHLQATIDGYLNQIAILEGRCGQRNNQHTGTPGW